MIYSSFTLTVAAIELELFAELRVDSEFFWSGESLKVSS